MKKLILILALLLFTGMALAQAPDTLWLHTFAGHGECDGRQIIRTNDGGLAIVASKVLPVGGLEIMLLRFGSRGNYLWTAYLDSGSSTRPYSVAQMPDNGFVIAGTYEQAMPSVYVSRVSYWGGLLWRKIYYYIFPTAYGRSVIVADSAIIVAGCYDMNHSISCIDFNDSLYWTRTYSTDHGTIWQIKPSLDSGYVMVGWIQNGTDSSSVRLTKLNHEFDEIWSRDLNGEEGNYEGRSVAVTPDSGYIVVGHVSENAMAAKYDKDGNLIWMRTDYGFGMANCIISSNSGGYIIGGYDIFSHPNPTVGHIIKINDAGDTLWTTSISYFNRDLGVRSVTEMPDGSIYATGYTGYQGGCVFLSKLGWPDTTNVEISEELPKTTTLLSAYPNPFNAQTTISYSLPKASDVSIEIFDITGRKIETIRGGFQQAGEHSLVWNAKDRASGVYFYRIKAGGFEKTERCVLLK
jgi:hypothetical protein